MKVPFKVAFALNAMGLANVFAFRHDSGKALQQDISARGITRLQNTTEQVSEHTRAGQSSITRLQNTTEQVSEHNRAGQSSITRLQNTTEQARSQNWDDLSTWKDDYENGIPKIQLQFSQVLAMMENSNYSANAITVNDDLGPMTVGKLQEKWIETYTKADVLVPYILPATEPGSMMKGKRTAARHRVFEALFGSKTAPTRWVSKDKDFVDSYIRTPELKRSTIRKWTGYMDMPDTPYAIRVLGLSERLDNLLAAVHDLVDCCENSRSC